MKNEINESMNCRLLKYRYLLSNEYSICNYIFILSLGLFLFPRLFSLDSLFLSILPFPLSLVSGFFCYIHMIKCYRYRNKRKILFRIYNPMDDCQTCVLISIGVATFIPFVYRVTLLPFLSGLIFFAWSKEIRRAKEQGFEKCGNWQIRYVLGIILMLPFPVYAIYDILRALGLL